MLQLSDVEVYYGKIQALKGVSLTVNPGANVPSHSGKKMDPEEIRRRILAEMREKVQLDDAQIKKVDDIMDKTRDEFDQLRKSMNEKMKPERDRIWSSQIEMIKAVLRPDQLPLYDKYRADREAERKKNRLPDHNK